MQQAERVLSAGGAAAGTGFANNLTRDASGRLRNARGQFASDAEIALAGLDPVAERRGREAGGKLSKGIEQGIVRNSPLIVAAVSGALIAGAPAVLAASSLMFAGIGIAAAAQNDEVRAAWSGLGDLIKTEAEGIAEPITDEVIRAADELGAGFLRMEDDITTGVAAAAPQIDSLVSSVIRMGENAMPGMVRAVERSGPAMEGLGSLLESVGTGLTGMFDAISAHAPAAGSAFDSLGQIVGNLLPTIGELLGHGVELAEIVLPPVASALGVVSAVASGLGPILPAVALGFAAFRVAGVVAPMIATFAQQLAFTSLIGGKAGAAAGAASRAVAGLGTALPFVGVALAAYAVNSASVAEETRSFADALGEGGAAANAARKEIEDQSYWEKFQYNLANLGNTQDVSTAKMEDAREELERQRAAMTDVERTTAELAQAENELIDETIRFGENSPQAEAAQRRLADAQDAAAAAAEREQLALHGVTEAMIAQADQALASIDSGFAYRNSLNGLEDAQGALRDAIAHRNDADKDTRTSAEDVARAQLAVEEQVYRTALAFGQQQADMSGAASDTEEYARIVQETALQELYRLRDAAGPEMAGAINQQIARLEASGVTMQGTGVQAGALADQMRGLGIQVSEVPGYKFVRIEAPTDEQRARIEALGQKVVQLPDGSFVVTANTADAAADVDRFIAAQQQRTIYLQARVSGIAATGHAYSPAGIGGGRAAGGPIYGPGGGTDDLIPAVGPGDTRYRLSDGEHVLTAAEVRAAGGHDAVYELRRAILAGGGGQSQGGGYADGGAVGARGALVHADAINVIDGTPHEVARVLDLELRTRGV
jgi:hypothetical protein